MTRRRSARDVATALLWHQTTLIRFFDAAAWTTSTSVNGLFTQWRGHADGTLSVAVSCQFVWSISRKKILCTVTCVLLSMLISSVNILRSKWHLTPILRKQKKSQQSQQNWNLTVEFLVKNCKEFFFGVGQNYRCGLSCFSAPACMINILLAIWSWLFTVCEPLVLVAFVKL